MNQRVYEEDNYHLDADYKAIHAARKPKDKTTSSGERPAGDANRQRSECSMSSSAGPSIDACSALLDERLQQIGSMFERRLEHFDADVKDQLNRIKHDLTAIGGKYDELLRPAQCQATTSAGHRAAFPSRQDDELVSATYNKAKDSQGDVRTTLHQATRKGNLEDIISILAAAGDGESRKSLLCKGEKYFPDGRRPRSVNCLHVAAMNGFDHVVEYFVTVCGVDVNETNERNDTALMWATIEGRRATVELLIHLNANANVENDKGSTALYYAVRKQDSYLVELLLKQGHANANRQRERGLGHPLVLAAAMGSVDIVRLLLSHGADVNVGVHGGETSLHYSASEGHLDVCRILVEHGANIDPPDSMGETPLLEAARKNQVEVVDYLLSKLANSCRSTVNGYSAWTYAIEAADDGMLRVLLQNPFAEFTDYCATSKSGTYSSLTSLRVLRRHKLPQGFLPLHEAAKRGDTRKINLLLSHDISPDECDANGNTFVHAAAEANQWCIFEVSAASLKASNRNNQGKTPLHEACRLAHEKSVEALAKITQLNIKSSFGSTVLHEAVRSSNATDRLSAVRHIIKYIQLGRYWNILNEKDNRGYTALHWAVKGGCKELLPELRLLKLCVTDQDDNTPLHLAAASSDTDTFNKLVRLYPSDVKDAIQRANASSMTPLRLAILQGNQGIIECAISAGADLAAKEPDGKTILHWIAEKIVADNSRSEILMQAVGTITGASVAWFSMKNNTKMPDQPSDQYDQLQITALTTLFGNSVDENGFTVFQYATRIACIPLIQFISNLADSLIKPGVSPDITTKPSQSGSKQKVYPMTNVSTAFNKTEVKRSLKGTDSVSELVMSVLDFVVSNENDMSAAKILEINPFRDMAQIYWLWYKWLWSTLTFMHFLIVVLLTAYGVKYATSFNDVISLPTAYQLRNASSFNDTKVPEAKISLASCSRVVMPPVVACFVIFYAAAVTLFMISSLTNVSRHCFSVGCRRQQTSEKQRSQTCMIIIYRYGQRIGQIVWHFCGLCFAIGTLTVALSSLLCVSFPDYVLSIALLFGWIYTIYYLSRLKVLFKFSLIINLLFKDFLTFLLVYVLILLAFSVAQHVSILHIANYSQQSFGQTTFITFQWLVGMNSFWDIDVATGEAEEGRFIFLAVLYVAHISICTIVLLNMLIAAMSDSFTEIRNNSNESWKVYSLRRALMFQKTAVLFLCCWLFCRLPLIVRRRCCLVQSKPSEEEQRWRWFLQFVNAGHQPPPKGKRKPKFVLNMFDL